MDLVGRRTELERMEAAVAAVRGGATRVLLITGEPGIGKTRLLDALVARAAGMRVLRARAAEQERDVPFALAVETLDDAIAGLHPSRRAALDPELGGVLPSLDGGEAPVSAAQRFRAHRALRGALEELAIETPIALVLDDLHWADQASLEWVLHALRRPARRPHLMALAVREVDPLPLLLEAMRGLEGAEHLAVRGLSDADAAVLLDTVPEARRARLIAEAGGNPLYLEGLARSGTDALPASVMAAVAQEIAELPASARTLLEGAAVAGDPFHPELAAVAAGFPGGQAPWKPLDVLAAQGLIATADEARLRFRHPLVRRAVYDAAPPGRRIAAHARLAQALADRGADAVTRARHVEAAASVGDADAARTLAEAGRASAASAPASAARWFAAALRLHPGMPPDERAALLVAQAEALAATGRPAEARDVLLEVLAGLPPDAVALRLELIALTASVEHALGRHAEARRRIDSALDGNADPPAALRARLDFERVVGAVYAQDLETLALAGGSADTLRSTEPALAVADEGIAVLGALWNERFAEVPPRLADVRAKLAATPAEAMRARPEVFFQTAYMEYATEHLPEARALLTAGLAVIRDGGQDRMLAPLATLNALAGYVAGDLAAAVESAELAEETARLQGLDYSVQWVLWVRALIAELRGERELALRLGEECLEISARFGDLLVTRAGRASIATLHAESDPERAVREIIAAAGERFELVDVAGSGYLILFHTQALLAIGRRAEAEAAVALLEDLAARSGLGLAPIRARIARSMLALAHDDAESAVAAGRDAVALAAGTADRRDATYADLALGRALGRAGDREGAVEVLRAASRRAAGGSMWLLRDTAARELRRLGSRLDAATSVAGAAHGLTDRERQVADHAAAGRSNKEIAALLFLSPKTIEHTLTRVYAKVGVRSRAALAAELVR